MATRWPFWRRRSIYFFTQWIHLSLCEFNVQIFHYIIATFGCYYINCNSDNSISTHSHSSNKYHAGNGNFIHSRRHLHDLVSWFVDVVQVDVASPIVICVCVGSGIQWSSGSVQVSHSVKSSEGNSTLRVGPSRHFIINYREEGTTKWENHGSETCLWPPRFNMAKTTPPPNFCFL